MISIHFFIWPSISNRAFDEMFISILTIQPSPSPQCKYDKLMRFFSSSSSLYDIMTRKLTVLTNDCRSYQSIWRTNKKLMNLPLVKSRYLERANLPMEKKNYMTQHK